MGVQTAAANNCAGAVDRHIVDLFAKGDVLARWTEPRMCPTQTFSLTLHRSRSARGRQDLLSRCMAGEVVAATDIARLLKQTRNLLLKERVVRRIPAPQEAERLSSWLEIYMAAYPTWLL